jgi:hypothetical protein
MYHFVLNVPTNLYVKKSFYVKLAKKNLTVDLIVHRAAARILSHTAVQSI